MNICDFIDNKSKDIFNFLTDVFHYKLTYSELGLTDLLVYELTKFIKTNSINNIDLLRITSDIECVFGNDLDIFIENYSKTYNWFVFQAKVLGPNGAYNDLKPKKKNPQQWEKLKLHETVFGSKAYYLLYSGQPKIKTKQISGQSIKSDCKGNFNFDNIGLGMVAADKILKIRSSKRNSQNLYLNELFPNEMECLRNIICCGSKFKNVKTYNKSEILSPELYTKILLSDFKDEHKNQIKNDNYFDDLLSYGASRTRIIINTPENV